MLTDAVLAFSLGALLLLTVAFVLAYRHLAAKVRELGRLGELLKRESSWIALVGKG